MTGLARTGLTIPQRVELGAAAIAEQGRWGAVSSLAEDFGTTRDTVYSAREQATEVLTRHFEQAPRTRAALTVTEALVMRAIVALRVVAPNSLRAIQGLIPVLYPGVSVSFGYVQGVVAQAERRAAKFNRSVDLSGVDALAVDEMFSQGKPALAGVDLDFGFLAALELRESRSGDDWQEVLRRLADDQHLHPRLFVKDAAQGIAKGISAVFPQAEQRDDVFHALYEMNKASCRFESAAYKALEAQFAIERRITELPRGKKSVTARLKSLRGNLTRARAISDRRIDRYDDFRRACSAAREAMQIVDLESGSLRPPERMRRAIKAAAARMRELDHPLATRIGNYIANRADGLVLYAEEMHARLSELAEKHGSEVVRLAALVVRLSAEARRTRPWQDSRHAGPLVVAWSMLHELPDGAAVLAAVEHIFVHRHRASSAIEGFNAALRPHLYVHKRATQGFLELFRAYFNLRRRQWGRHKGTAPYELLTGTRVDDWLTMLGYPLPAQIH